MWELRVMSVGVYALALTPRHVKQPTMCVIIYTGIIIYHSGLTVCSRDICIYFFSKSRNMYINVLQDANQYEYPGVYFT